MIVITGKVIHGEHYGRKLGFPTANMDRRSFSRRKMRVRLGVWAGSAVVGNGLDRSLQDRKNYPAAIVIGPIDKSGLPKIEAHLIGFKGNLYGKRLSIYLSIYLRPFRKFKNEEELKNQIKRDIALVKKL